MRRFLLLLLISSTSYLQTAKLDQKKPSKIIENDKDLQVSASDSIWKNGEPTQLLRDIFAILSLPPIENLEMATLIANQKFIRPRDKERWDGYQTISEIERKKLEPLLRNSPLTCRIMPKQKRYESIVILGATSAAVEKRYKFLFDLSEQGICSEKIYLLGSTRELKTGNASDQEFAKQLEALSIPTTEMEMMLKIWDQLEKPALFRTVVPIPVQAPNHPDGTRANTEDTLNALIELNDDLKQVLIISNNPYVSYQHAVCRKVLGKHDLAIETMGDAASIEERIENILDSIARTLTNLLKAEK